MRAAPGLLLLSACGGSSVAIATLGPEPTTFLVRGDAITWLDPAAPTSFAPSGEDIALLRYAETPSAMLLELDESGRLALATAGDDPEGTWPLPTPARAERFDATSVSFASLEGEALAALLARFRVPAPPCGAFEPRGSAPIDFDFGADKPVRLANRGDVAIVVSSAPSDVPQPVLRLAADGSVTQLEGLRPQHRTRYVFDEVDRFVIVATTTNALSVYDVTTDGQVTERYNRRVAVPSILDLGHHPGAEAFFARGGAAIRRLDGTGHFRQVAAVEVPPPDAACDLARPSDDFIVDGPEGGVVSFTLAGLFRFGEAPVEKVVEVPSPCTSGYAAFGETELVYTLSATHDGATSRIDWRPDRSAEWRQDVISIGVHKSILAGAFTLTRDTVRDELFLLGYDARRPEERPRVCDRLDVANVRNVSWDGSTGAAISYDGARYDAVRFTLRPPP